MNDQDVYGDYETTSNKIQWHKHEEHLHGNSFANIHSLSKMNRVRMHRQIMSFEGSENCVVDRLHVE